ncbi:MAG: hypothetical protein FD153_603 [Rhodospirillaceae bacterium]|nr:MAG: hypothetical protein FD153_603 [Rhodospirillaceae bacterium]
MADSRLLGGASHAHFRLVGPGADDGSKEYECLPLVGFPAYYDERLAFIFSK